MAPFGSVQPVWVTSVIGGAACLIVASGTVVLTWGYPNAAGYMAVSTIMTLVGAGLVVFGVWLRKRDPTF